MSKENIIMICGIVFLVVVAIAAFNDNMVQDTAVGVFHEIKTADVFGDADPAQQAGFTPGCPIPAGAGGQGMMMQPGAKVGLTVAGTPPELVKIMGVEAMEIVGGKVKVTGVMGSSWADKAGLVPGDILLSMNGRDITSFAQFKADLAALPPEKDYKFTYLRGASKKKGLIFVGEGEMEGFLPIPQPK